MPRKAKLTNYVAKYTKISSGFMGQLIEWPEVISEGRMLQQCRGLLQDALHEMILAYKQQKKQIPFGPAWAYGFFGMPVAPLPGACSWSGSRRMT